MAHGINLKRVTKLLGSFTHPSLRRLADLIGVHVEVIERPEKKLLVACAAVAGQCRQVANRHVAVGWGAHIVRLAAKHRVIPAKAIATVLADATPADAIGAHEPKRLAGTG